MKDCREDPSTMSAEGRKDLGIIQQFPKSIGEALQYLDEDEQVRRTLGQPAVDTYLVVKRTESEFLRRMDPEKRRNWIIERY